MRGLFRNVALGFAALLMLPVVALAQDTGEITGTVYDAESGTTLPGANVLLVGTEQGDNTDANGVYDLIGVTPGTYTLRASFQGYTDAEVTVTVAAGEEVEQDLRLAQDVEALEEVVVSGYRVQPGRREPTGASSYVGQEDLENRQMQNVENALQGKVAGAQIVSSSGAPGAGALFRIRGEGSINAGTEPLIIIDGIQINNNDNADFAQQSPLSAINPNDIESVEILKDVAARSIYGAQAANGVVLITTKRGRSGNTRVNFNASVGAVDRIRDVDVLSAQEYSQIKYESYVNYYGSANLCCFPGNRTVGEQSIALFGDPNVADADRINTNWQDGVYRTGLSQKYDLSVSGGDEQTTFYVSGNYEDTEGQIIASAFTRGGLRASLDHKFYDKLQIRTDLNLATLTTQGTSINAAGTYIPQFGTVYARPDRPIYNLDEDGNPRRELGYYNGADLQNDIFSYNLVQKEDFNTQEANTNNLNGSVSLIYQALPGLVLRSFGGVNHVDTQADSYEDPRIPFYGRYGGEADTRARRRTNITLSQQLNYGTELFEDAEFTGLAVAEYRAEDEEFNQAVGRGFPSAQFRTLQNAGEPFDVASFRTQFRQMSAVAEGTLDYDNRYIFSSTARYDGNSRFGEDNRWGLFGSVSGAWRLSEESFFETDAVDNLLLRVSYGTVGNSSISNFASRQLFVSLGNYEDQTGIGPNGLGNPLLTWEEEEEINIGLDFSLFGGRVGGSANVYRADSERLLLDRPIPSDSGFGVFTDNIGSVRNEALELELSTINLDFGPNGFRWDTDFNITFPRNEILTLIDGQTNALRDGAECISVTQCVGDPLGQLRYPRFAGVNPADGRPFFYDENDELTYTLDNADAQIIGNRQSDFFGGLSNTFSFKGLSLGAFFVFDYGKDVLNNDFYFADQAGQSTYNQLAKTLDRWQRPGQVTAVPKPIRFGVYDGASSTGHSFSTRYVEDASFIRLKTLRLGYQLPAGLSSRLSMTNAEIYVTGRNLLTFTEFTGLDPEFAGGVGLAEYPQSQELTVGVNLGF